MRRFFVSLVLLLACVLSGCTNSGKGAASIVGTWTLTQVVEPNGQRVAIRPALGTVITLGEIRDTRGSDGVNNFSGHYGRSGDTLNFNEVAIGAVGLGPGAAGDQKAAQAGFAALLSGHPVALTRSSSTLTLKVSGYTLTLMLKQ